MRARGLALVMALVACAGGDDDQPAGDRQLAELTPAEVEAYCAEAVLDQGGPGTSTSCDDFDLTVVTADVCVANFPGIYGNCTATVAQAQACNVAFGAAPCTLGGTTCQPLLECVQP